jgi:catechol 2,3-dioxygenase-like lactoylglutathione lyase family enzyme
VSLTSIVGLDHFILLVTDLDRAQAKFEKLGFALTPRGFHVQQPTQNHTAVFANNYLELLYYPPDLRAASRFANFPADYEGPVAVALQPTSSDTVHAELEAMGLNPTPVIAGGRPVQTPDGEKRARWRNQRFPDDAPSLPSTFCCGHQTREAVYLAGAEVHPNGAKRLSELVMVHPEPASLLGSYVKLFGESSISSDAEGVTVRPGTAVWRVLTPASFATRFPGVTIAEVPPTGRFVGAVLQVASLAKVTSILDGAGIAASKTATGGVVPPPDASAGLVLEFREG